MKVEQNIWTVNGSAQSNGRIALGEASQLVLAFGATEKLAKKSTFDSIRAAYPKAHVIGCSTAGEIAGTRVLDDSLVVTAASFEHTRLKTARVRLDKADDSLEAGRKLANALPRDGLVHVFVISDGLKVNGTSLVQGLTENLPPNVALTGGLSGDGARFGQTLVCSDAHAEAGLITAVGFYGDRLKVGYGSMGGWDPFGPVRRITRSKGNVLFELDGQSALALYKKYLGQHAANLPSSGLLFPLSLKTDENAAPVVRTVLSIDEAAQSMTFAGDLPEGACAQLMKANFDRLIDGATSAAQSGAVALGNDETELAVLISCVGRKLVLKQRIEEEVESVRDVLGADAVLAGFYSYGEISPFTPTARCELHNQTMTVTTFAEH
jgi:hypothetical protein